MCLPTLRYWKKRNAEPTKVRRSVDAQSLFARRPVGRERCAAARAVRRPSHAAAADSGGDHPRGRTTAGDDDLRSAHSGPGPDSGEIGRDHTGVKHTRRERVRENNNNNNGASQVRWRFHRRDGASFFFFLSFSTLTADRAGLVYVSSSLLLLLLSCTTIFHVAVNNARPVRFRAEFTRGPHAQNNNGYGASPRPNGPGKKSDGEYKHLYTRIFVVGNATVIGTCESRPRLTMWSTLAEGDRRRLNFVRNYRIVNCLRFYSIGNLFANLQYIDRWGWVVQEDTCTRGRCVGCRIKRGCTK